MEAVISIWLWHAFGQPDFLYRGNEIGFMAAFYTIVGIILGLVYGLILNGIAKRVGKPLLLYQLFIFLLALGAITYWGFYWITLKDECPLFFWADIVMIVSALIVANFWPIKKDTQQEDANRPAVAVD